MGKIIKKECKHLIGHLLWRWCAVLAFVRQKCFRHVSKQEPIEILKKAGYTFPNPMPDCPPLCTDTIDVSIIVPVYNVSKYLRKCIESIVQNETTYSYEVICVNDGSKDDCLTILQSLAKRYPQIVVYSQTNQGLSAARNMGIRHARGKYVSFVDSDDYVDKDYIQHLMDKIVETGADIVQGNYMIVDEKSSYKAIGQKKANVVFDVSDIARYDNYLHGFAWMAIYKKSMFEQIRFPYGFMFEDNVTWQALVPNAKRIAVIEQPLYYYLIRSTSLCNDKSLKGSIRCVDQCWGILSIGEYWVNESHKPFSQWQYGCMLGGLSRMLEARTAGLSSVVKRAMFDISAAYIQEWNFDYHPVGKFSKYVFDAFMRGDYLLYKSTIKATKWKK